MDNQEQAPAPNLPVVAVRGISSSDAMLTYERYHLDFTPPDYNHLKLCEVIIALEEMVMEFTRAEARHRSDLSARVGPGNSH